MIILDGKKTSNDIKDEIADEVNSIIIGDINETVNRIEKILQSSILFDKLRKNAYLQWINVKNYSQSVEENCYKYISSFKK